MSSIFPFNGFQISWLKYPLPFSYSRRRVTIDSNKAFAHLEIKTNLIMTDSLNGPPLNRQKYATITTNIFCNNFHECCSDLCLTIHNYPSFPVIYRRSINGLITAFELICLVPTKLIRKWNPPGMTQACYGTPDRISVQDCVFCLYSIQLGAFLF